MSRSSRWPYGTVSTIMLNNNFTVMKCYFIQDFLSSPSPQCSHLFPLSSSMVTTFMFSGMVSLCHLITLLHGKSPAFFSFNNPSTATYQRQRLIQTGARLFQAIALRWACENRTPSRAPVGALAFAPTIPPSFPHAELFLY